MIKLHLQTKLNPTEEREKIAGLFNLFYEFPTFSISDPDEEQVCTFEAEAEGPDTLNYLFNQIRRQRTVEAVRKQVLRRMDLNHQSVSFMVHKQALMNSKIVLCTQSTESPLGPIYVTITADNIERTINYLFPPTEDGKVLEADYSLS